MSRIAACILLLIADPPTSDFERELREIRQLVVRQAEQLEAQKAEITQLRTEVDQLKHSVPADPTSETGQDPQVSEELNERIERAIERFHAAEPPNGVQTGYDNGFFIRSSDGANGGGVHVPFRLTSRGIIQTRHTLVESNEPALTDRNDLELERARLQFSGYFFRPYIAFAIAVDGDTDSGGTVRAFDSFVDYTFSEPLGWDAVRMGVRFGKWKSPFGRQWILPFWQTQFTDRALASVYTLPNRSVGIALYGDGKFDGIPYHWTTALTNGFSTHGIASDDLDTNLATVGHVWLDLLDRPADSADPWKDGEPDLERSPQPALRVGGSWFVTRIDASSLEFEQPLSIDRGRSLASLLLPLGVSEYSFAQQGLDVGLKYQGLSLWSEYFFREVYDYSGGDPHDLFDHGFYVQGGYFLVPHHFEALARYSVLWGDSGTLGARATEGSEIALGLAYYVRDHNLKIVSDVSWLDGAPVNNTSLNIRAGEDGLLWRTQIQIMW